MSTRIIKEYNGLPQFGRQSAVSCGLFWYCTLGLLNLASGKTTRAVFF